MAKGKLVKNMPRWKFDSLHTAMKDSLKNPYIGVTQGGSSRKNGGAKPAATSSANQRKGK